MINIGYCIWVDGAFLSSWPKERYTDDTCAPDVGRIVRNALIFDNKDKAESVAQELRDFYQWNIDEMIQVIKVRQKQIWEIEDE